MHIFTGIVILSVLLTPRAAHICPINEVYMECGTACPATCERFLQRQVECMSTECVEGCFCREGMARDFTGKCIVIFECLDYISLCGDNEEFLECGTGCPKTCENLAETPTCSNGCVPECACNEGFVRNSTGNCVMLSECPAAVGVTGVTDSECEENQVKTDCGTLCPETCDNYTTSTDCVSGCRSGCVCALGYVLLNDNTDKCVEISECPYKQGHKHGDTHSHGDRHQHTHRHVHPTPQPHGNSHNHKHHRHSHRNSASHGHGHSVRGSHENDNTNGSSHNNSHLSGSSDRHIHSKGDSRSHGHPDIHRSSHGLRHSNGSSHRIRHPDHGPEHKLGRMNSKRRIDTRPTEKTTRVRHHMSRRVRNNID